jgi:hypothetical protein
VSSGGEDFDAGDFRTDEQIRYDAMSEQARQVTEQAKQVTELVRTFMERMPSSTTQTVIHKMQGMGPWGAAAVTACFLTYLSLILFALWSVFQINNLWAWKDIHAGRIGKLESQAETHK